MIQRPVVLLVDTEATRRQEVSTALRGVGWLVEERGNSAEAPQLLWDRNIDAVVIALPPSEGHALCRLLRRSADVPILLVGNTRQIDRVLRAFECGADDYIGEPIDSREMIARLTALLRRTALAERRQQRRIRIDGLQIDSLERRVIVAGREVNLSPTEFDLLYLLASNPGTPLQRRLLYHRIWNSPYQGDTNLIDVCVRRLRRKIERKPSAPQWVKTVRGVGYMFAGTS